MATSAPRPAQPTPEAETGEATHGEQVRDERSPGKRRVDALMDLVGAGARAATGEGVQTAAATVLLTMNLETLTTGTDGATTTTGDVLDAGAARRLACAADLIPAVLGGPSAPLDVGRRQRLGHQSHPRRSHPARPRVHLPRLRPTTRLLRNPPPPTLVGRRRHLRHQLRTAVLPTPSDRPPAGLHRNRPPRPRGMAPHTRADARTPHRSSLRSAVPDNPLTPYEQMPDGSRLLIRPEQTTDVEAIRAVTAAAFRSAAHSAPPMTPGGDPGEATLVSWLRDDPAWIHELSLVALEDDAVIGHVLCTRAHLDGEDALGLGPLSVLPERQGTGVGSALVHAVLAAADGQGERLVALLGEPGYYGRFGFVPAREVGITAPDPSWGDYFQIRTLSGYEGKGGTFRYAEPSDRL